MRFIKSESYFPVIVLVHLILWVVDLAVLHDGPIALNPGEDPIQRVIGEVLSSWVITVFGFNLLMTTRARWVERIFGGLDKMYLIHRRSGVIIFVLLLLHFAVVPRDPIFVPGKPLGFAAMVLILLGVIFAAAPIFRRKLPYHKWRLGHRLMGIFFVVGVAHALSVRTLISELPLVRVYVFGMAAVGVASWLYRIAGHRRVHPPRPYSVSRVQRWGRHLVEITMAPGPDAISHKPGQFAFFSFPTIGPAESHPFTIASAPGDAELRIAVKASGDFTEKLVHTVAVGDVVNVEGPYGHLTPERFTRKRQIWVAGGVGITPFLSMARALKADEDLAVTLIWSVRNGEEAFFHDELTALAAERPNFTYALWNSAETGYLSVNDFKSLSNDTAATPPADLDYVICGPLPLRDALVSALRGMGVPRGRLHFEEFSFR